MMLKLSKLSAGAEGEIETNFIGKAWNIGKGKCVPAQLLTRQDPLEAILVIFGRRALIFLFVWKLLEKMKNDTTLMRMRSGDHLGNAKMSKRGTSLRRI